MEATKQLTPFLSVIGQIQPKDMTSVAAAGFLTVINNRPDQEGEDQPSSVEMAEAAQAAGLQYYYLPVIAGQISDQNVADFAQLLAQVKGPVLAFCRTGTRSSSLWALSWFQLSLRACPPESRSDATGNPASSRRSMPSRTA